MMHNHTRFSVRSVKSVFILLPFGVVLYSVVLFLFYTKLLQNMKSPRHVLAWIMGTRMMVRISGFYHIKFFVVSLGVWPELADIWASAGSVPSAGYPDEPSWQQTQPGRKKGSLSTVTSPLWWVLQPMSRCWCFTPLRCIFWDVAQGKVSGKVIALPLLHEQFLAHLSSLYFAWNRVASP